MVAYGEQKTKYVKLLVEKVVEVVKKFNQWSLTRKFLKQHLTEKQNGYVQSRSPMRSAHYERVDCITSFPSISESQGSLVSGWSHYFRDTISYPESSGFFVSVATPAKCCPADRCPRLKSSKDCFSQKFLRRKLVPLQFSQLVTARVQRVLRTSSTIEMLFTVQEMKIFSKQR